MGETLAGPLQGMLPSGSGQFQDHQHLAVGLAEVVVTASVALGALDIEAQLGRRFSSSQSGLPPALTQ